MEKLTIVITTKNKYPLTRYCLESIAWTLPRSSYSIVIVDDNSTDETTKLADQFQFIENSSGSLYAGWNLGIDAAETRYVAVLNNDIICCTQDWWYWFHRAFRESNASWLYPVMAQSQSLDFGMYELVRQASLLREPSYNRELGTLEAAFFLIDKEKFNQLGQFDERFFIWYGEKDYEARMLQAGHSYGRVQNVAIRHFGSSTIKVDLPRHRPFELEDSDTLDLDERVRLDYEVFLEKYDAASFEAIGLRMPGFGRVPLIDDPRYVNPPVDL